NVTLAWNASPGGLQGGQYHLLRDDRTIATTGATSITVPLEGEHRYFVRAADPTGNLSASTSVLTIPGGNTPPVPVIEHAINGLNVTFDAAGSSDDGEIIEYSWNFGDGQVASGATQTHTYLAEGSYDV